MCELLPEKGDVISVCPCKIDNNIIELDFLDEKYSGKKALLAKNLLDNEKDLNIKLINFNLDNINDEKFIVKILNIKKLGTDIHVDITCLELQNKNKQKQRALKKQAKQQKKLEKQQKKQLKIDDIDILFKESNNEEYDEEEDDCVYLSKEQKVDGLNELFDDFLEDINEKITDNQIVKTVELNNWINLQYSCLKIQVNLETSEITSISMNRLLNKYNDKDKICSIIDILKDSFTKQISTIDTQVEFIEQLDHHLRETDITLNILYILYNKDILEEEAILKWYDKKNNKYSLLNKKTISFVEWLKTADTDSDSDSHNSESNDSEN